MTKKINEILPVILHQENNWKFNLLNAWQTILGDLSSNVTLEKIEEDTLVLGVQDSCWLQELYMLSSVLLKTINQSLDKPRIKQLRFKTLGVKKAKTLPLKPQQKTHKVFPLSLREQHSLEQIKDEQLRLALKKFLMRCNNER